MHETHEEERHWADGTWNAAVDESREFLGRTVWVHCNRGGRVHFSSRLAKSKKSRKGSIGRHLRLHNFNTRAVCWLETLCGPREPSVSLQTRPATPQMLFVCHAMQDDRAKAGRIVEYKTHLIRRLSYTLTKAVWVTKALMLSSIEPEAPAISHATIRSLHVWNSIQRKGVHQTDLHPRHCNDVVRTGA